MEDPWGPLVQGAPRSHYLADHPLALMLADGLDIEPGRLLSLAGILVFAWLWVLAVGARVTWRGKLALPAIACELTFVVANILFSAGAAYHHVGWGMSCNDSFGGSLVMLQVIVGVIAAPWILLGLVLWAVVRGWRAVRTRS